MFFSQTLTLGHGIHQRTSQVKSLPHGTYILGGKTYSRQVKKLMHAIIRVACALKKIKPVKRINGDVVGAGLFSYNVITLDSRDLKKVSEPCVLVMGFTLKSNKTIWLFCGQRCGEV